MSKDHQKTGLSNIVRGFSGRRDQLFVSFDLILMDL